MRCSVRSRAHTIQGIVTSFVERLGKQLDRQMSGPPGSDVKHYIPPTPTTGAPGSPAWPSRCLSAGGKTPLNLSGRTCKTKKTDQVASTASVVYPSARCGNRRTPDGWGRLGEPGTRWIVCGESPDGSIPLICLVLTYSPGSGFQSSTESLVYSRYPITLG